MNESPYYVYKPKDPEDMSNGPLSDGENPLFAQSHALLALDVNTPPNMFHEEFSATTSNKEPPQLPYASLLTKPINLPPTK
jgi:hypothetical protein